MSDEFASFRELRGIGPAIETRLHQAGLHTWQSLSDVLLALNSIRGRTGDTLRELAELAAARAASPDEETCDGPEGGEKYSESFLVRIALFPGGMPSRTSVTRVRTQATHSHTGWSPHQVGRFVEDVLGLPDPATSAGGGQREGEPAVTGTAPPPPQGTPGDSGRPPGDSGRPVLAQEHAVVLLAGTVIGGGERSLTATVSTGDLPVGEDFSYEASLLARPLGHPDPDPRTGTELARGAGHGRAPEPLEIPFPTFTVPAGIQRLRLLLSMRLARAVRGPLHLDLDIRSSSTGTGTGTGTVRTV